MYIHKKSRFIFGFRAVTVSADARALETYFNEISFLPLRKQRGGLGSMNIIYTPH
jgi:hypothetical protein